MPSVDIKVEISGDLAKKMLDASERMTNEVNKALYASALYVQGVIIKKISRGGRGSGAKSGKRLASVGNNKFNRSDQQNRSAPGEPPKSDTGRLVGSIRVERGFLTASIGSDVLYAPFLEFGTSKMAERPYLRPSLDESENTIQQLIEAAMQRTMGE